MSTVSVCENRFAPRSVPFKPAASTAEKCFLLLQNNNLTPAGVDLCAGRADLSQTEAWQQS